MSATAAQYLAAAETRLTSSLRDLDRAADRLEDQGRPDEAALVRELAGQAAAVLRAVRRHRSTRRPWHP